MSENISVGTHTAVGELLAGCSDPQTKVSSLVLKAQIIAAELEDNDFLAFLTDQLEGYYDKSKTEDQIPAYRAGNLSVAYFNPYRGWDTVGFAKKEHQELFCRKIIPNSVHELESGAENEKDSYVLLPMELQNELRKVDSDAEHQDFYWFIPRSRYKNILDRIRVTIQNWCLELKKKGIHGTTVIFSQKEKDCISKEPINMAGMTVNFGVINHNTTHGDSSLLITGNDNTVINNDVESLKKAVISHGVSVEDFDKLLQIINQAGGAKANRATLASKVTGWLASVANDASVTLTITMLIPYIHQFLGWIG